MAYIQQVPIGNKKDPGENPGFSCLKGKQTSLERSEWHTFSKSLLEIKKTPEKIRGLAV